MAFFPTSCSPFHCVRVYVIPRYVFLLDWHAHHRNTNTPTLDSHRFLNFTTSRPGSTGKLGATCPLVHLAVAHTNSHRKNTGLAKTTKFFDAAGSANTPKEKSIRERDGCSRSCSHLLDVAQSETVLYGYSDILTNFSLCLMQSRGERETTGFKVKLTSFTVS